MPLRRLIGVMLALVVLAGVALCRVYWISTETGYATSAGAQTVSDTALPQTRGDFFDRNGARLTGAVKKWYALCVPGDSSYATLFPYVSYRQQAELYDRRNSITPFLVEIGQNLSNSGVYCYPGAKRYLPLPIAAHLIGYLDGEGHGVSGLERAYEDLLAASGDVQTVACVTTARGQLITGTEPEVCTQAPGTGQGVRLTLDTAVQRACEGIAQQDLPRGCILVLDSATAQVLASVSMPEFDPDDVAKSIAANDTSLINRPLAAFSAGSVFKVVLAIAAYQAGLDWFTYTCTGSVEVGDQSYRCALGRAHGEVNLRGALEQSCNGYFIELGQALGYERILPVAEALGFGVPTVVAPGLKSAAGVLPGAAALQNLGQLAMFSFGQGSLTVTPLQIAAMLNTLAAGGIYRAPSFVQGVVAANGAVAPATAVPAEPVQVCDAATARILRDMLCTVVTEGIGGEAQPMWGQAGGKTGTAQTGQHDGEGRELLNYWFAGFYPAEQPRYTIVVLQDATLEPEVSSAAIFARVADALHAMQGDETAP